MIGYSPHGRAHSALRRLAQGTATFDGLQAFACANVSPSKLAKFKFLMRAMKRDGLVDLEGNTYSITDTGRDALADLEAGRWVDGHQPRPNVRVFAQAVAHG